MAGGVCALKVFLLHSYPLAMRSELWWYVFLPTNQVGLVWSSLKIDDFMLHFMYIVLLDVYANESGSNKLQASKNCALSLVRQLYHLKVIEAFTGIKKKKLGDEVKNCIDAVT